MNAQNLHDRFCFQPFALSKMPTVTHGLGVWKGKHQPPTGKGKEAKTNRVHTKGCVGILVCAYTGCPILGDHK